MNPTTGPTKVRLGIFASADFAFNLYWQSVMMFLLFFYTETLGISIEVAATAYMLASIWDGIISFAVGLASDRKGLSQHYSRALTWGAVPLGVCFVLMYLPIDANSRWQLGVLFGAHFLFRTAYGMVNVPYLAMSARISSRSDDRSFVSGARMIFGTLAAVVVSLLTVPMGTAFLGPDNSYAGSAILFAIVATIILIFVGRTYRDEPDIAAPPPLPVKPILRSLAANRSFVMLSLSMMAMIVAVTLVGKSVLYYFKYFIHDEAAGQLALAQMMATGLISVPAWMVVARWTSVRFVWILSVSACIALLILFSMVDLLEAGAMQAFLIAFHGSVMGLNFALWALLPEAIDYGEATLGTRVEATVFGVTALLQRCAIGLATGLLGWGFHEAGFTSNATQNAETLADIRSMLSAWPLFFFIVSALAILLAPGLAGSRGKRPRRSF